MKYLDHSLLTQLSSSLSSNPSPELRVNVRFEAYSVKPIGKERKMFKEMEEAYVSGQDEMEEMSFSPEMREAGLSSCFGRLDEKESRKVHFLLVSTLNSAFPDHDFASLRPDHFTREPSSSQVLGQLSGSLLGPSGTGETSMLVGQMALNPTLNPNATGTSAPVHVSPPLKSSSPSKSSADMTNPDLHRILNEVVPLDECEVFSWYPEPEYDPHIDAEDGETSEDGFELDAEEEAENKAIGADKIEVDETPASWGQGGMELDDMPKSVQMVRTWSSSGKDRRKSGVDTPEEMGDDEREGGRGSRAGGLLWSANYFFYSKRQKRVLFLTCWCRKRLSQIPTAKDTDSFPLPISSAFTPSIPHAQGNALSPNLRSYRPPRSNHNRSNARSGQRKSKLNLKAAAKGDSSNTIPIRGFETPKAPRLASSAPSTYSPLHPTASPASALAKMTAGGFKPRQTPARAIKNAASKGTIEAESTGEERGESVTPRQGHLGDLMASGEPRRETMGTKRVKV